MTAPLYWTATFHIDMPIDPIEALTVTNQVVTAAPSNIRYIGEANCQTTPAASLALSDWIIPRGDGGIPS